MASFLPIVLRLSDPGLAGILHATVVGLSLLVWPARSAVAQEAPCKAKVYLTLDTGNMRFAEAIADVLERHQVKATFFVANEKTFRGDFALDDGWAEFWRARVREGHQFGSHTFDHVYFRQEGATSGVADAATHLAKPQFGSQAGKSLRWTDAQVCRELRRVDDRFRAMTGQNLAPLWRAPGGKAPAAVMLAAEKCGYRHVFWAAAGFLGDELPSETFPNDRLLSKALAEIRNGDILMAHLGIWSRKDPFAPMLDPLIAGLKSRGFCFATIKG